VEGSRVQGLGLGVQGLRLGVQGSGLRVPLEPMQSVVWMQALGVQDFGVWG